MTSEAANAEGETTQVMGLSRLFNNMKENNVSWMVAILVAYQMGILDKLLAYGAGMC